MSETTSYPIKLIQVGVLTGETLSQDGLIHIHPSNDCEIDLNGDNVFYQFHDTQSRFYAILEIDKENVCECFELTLKADFHQDDLEEFEIIQDNEYKEMMSYLLKEKLTNSLALKDLKKQTMKV